MLHYYFMHYAETRRFEKEEPSICALLLQRKKPT
jgi:hypothetical protein